jgi:hypothetical protein
MVKFQLSMTENSIEMTPQRKREQVPEKKTLRRYFGHKLLLNNSTKIEISSNWNQSEQSVHVARQL